MNTKQTLVAVIAVLVILGGLAFYVWKMPGTAQPAPLVDVTTFEECAQHYTVMESYPRRCVDSKGNQYNEDIGNEQSKLDLITIDTPRPNGSITSPVTITGKARGTWYFEASFPVELQDANGNVIAQSPAQAQGDWMTENFVPYKVTLTYKAQPKGSHGKLILKKDNPSGEPSRDDSLIVPVVFN